MIYTNYKISAIELNSSFTNSLDGRRIVIETLKTIKIEKPRDKSEKESNKSHFKDHSKKGAKDSDRLRYHSKSSKRLDKTVKRHTKGKLNPLKLNLL